MSKPGGRKGGGGGGGGAASSRVKIPDSVRPTILSIREITGKQHTDDDIYSVLRECSMDPNDTAQKLLYLDTFHEVKRKRDRKKEISQTFGTLNRGSRSGWGNNSAKHVNKDVVGGRNAIHQRDHGPYQKTERGPSTSLAVKERVKSNAADPETKASTFMPNGPSNGSFGCGPLYPVGKDANLIHDIPDDDVKKLSSLSLLRGVPSSTPDKVLESVIQEQQGILASPASLSGVYSSASDPVLPPSIARNLGAVGAIKREVRSQPSAVENNHIQGDKHISPYVETEVPKIEMPASTVIYTVNEKTESGKLKAADMNGVSETPNHSLPTHNSLLANLPASVVDDIPQAKNSDVPNKAVVTLEDEQTKKSSTLLPEQSITNGHVIFPDHFKVPEAMKSGLTFGSFDSDSGTETKYGNDNGWELNSVHAVEFLHGKDGPAREPSPSDQSISSTIEDHPDQPESAQVFDKVPKPESDANPASDPKVDKQAQETILISEGHQNPSVQIAPNYGYDIMPPMQAGQFVQFEGHEVQARDVSRLAGLVNDNPTTSSSPSPSPSPTPPAQNLAASPQPILFRPPYPPNYFPYGHYYNPYFLPPMHQFLNQNGLPQYPSAVNTYLGPTAAAQGVKFPLPQFKPGTTNGTPTPVGIQSLYASYGSSPIGFNPGPPVTSGNTAGNENLAASQLKESQIYATGPLSDVSGWISAAGQDASSNLHLNSLYHVTPQGQHVALTPGHGPYPGIYAPIQTMAAPSTLVQQTQGSAAVETMGNPPSAFQHNQLAHLNWNGTYSPQ